MEAKPPPPPPKSFSMKPAFIVAALALVILVTFSIGAALSKHATPSRPLTSGPTRVPGSSLLAVPAAGALRPIETGGEPPGNVLDDITLPKGSVFSGTTNPGLGATYDEEATFSVDASQGAVLGFYQAELAHFGWRTVTSGPAEHQPGRQIVGEIAGDDGFYWELGVGIGRAHV